MRPILLAALILSSVPAVAATDTSHAEAAAASKPAAQTASAPDRKYCIASDETATDTRIVSRECRTKADWAKRGVDIDELKKQQ